MPRSVRAINALLLCFTILPVGVALADNKSFAKSLPATAGGTLVVRSDAGEIRVVGMSTDKVSVTAQIKGNRREVERFHITADRTENGIEVRGKAGESSWWSWWDWGFHRLNVAYTIQVPQTYNLRLDTDGGDISIENVKGAIDSDTSGGNIRLRDIAGPTSVDTSGGNIRVQRLTGNFEAQTSGGDIALSSITGNIEVRTSGGNIRIENVDGKIRAKTSGGNVIVAARGENKGIAAETSGGNIDIVFVSKDVRANLNLSTSGGSVRVDLPITLQGIREDDEIKGEVNGGGPAIHARTSGGDVSVRVSE